MTLVNSRRSLPAKRDIVAVAKSTQSLATRQATHAEYAGMVVFRNQFDGELPAVEYPKIGVS